MTVRISNLVNFTLDANVPNYGVMICDNSDPHNGNTAELCTNDPTGTHIPDITVTADANKTALNFLVPNTFPIYPAGVGGQGQGLTFFIVVQQSTALSIQFPSVSIR